MAVSFWIRLSCTLCTEAQMRAALHSHILVWMMKRVFSPQKKLKYEPLAPIPREACGSEPKQRPRNQHVPKLPANAYQEDNCYHRAEMARIWMAAWRLYKESIRMCRDAMFLQSILRISAKSHVFLQMVWKVMLLSMVLACFPSLCIFMGEVFAL